jgi:hypothetical protein
VKADEVIHKFEEEGRKNFAFSAGAVELLRYLGKRFVAYFSSFGLFTFCFRRAEY